MFVLTIHFIDVTSISEDFHMLSEAEIRAHKFLQSGYKGKQGEKTVFFPVHMIKKLEISTKQETGPSGGHDAPPPALNKNKN